MKITKVIRDGKKVVGYSATDGRSERKIDKNLMAYLCAKGVVENIGSQVNVGKMVYRRVGSEKLGSEQIGGVDENKEEKVPSLRENARYELVSVLKDGKKIVEYRLNDRETGEVIKVDKNEILAKAKNHEVSNARVQMYNGKQLLRGYKCNLKELKVEEVVHTGSEETEEGSKDEREYYIIGGKGLESKEYVQLVYNKSRGIKKVPFPEFLESVSNGSLKVANCKVDGGNVEITYGKEDIEFKVRSNTLRLCAGKNIEVIDVSVNEKGMAHLDLGWTTWDVMIEACGTVACGDLYVENGNLVLGGEFGYGNTKVERLYVKNCSVTMICHIAKEEYLSDCKIFGGSELFASGRASIVKIRTSEISRTKALSDVDEVFIGMSKVIDEDLVISRAKDVKIEETEVSKEVIFDSVDEVRMRRCEVGGEISISDIKKAIITNAPYGVNIRGNVDKLECEFSYQTIGSLMEEEHMVGSIILRGYRKAAEKMLGSAYEVTIVSEMLEARRIAGSGEVRQVIMVDGNGRR